MPSTPRIRDIRTRSAVALEAGRVDGGFHQDVIRATDDGCEWYIPAIEKALDEAGA